MTPWDQRLARVMVRPLVRLSVSPSAVTTVTLILGLGGAALLAAGEPWTVNTGAGLFVLARFLDHFDGELARQSGRTSRAGYYYDYAVGGLSYAALFLALGFAVHGGVLGDWPIALGLAGATAAVASLFFNLDLDRHLDPASGSDSYGYPAYAGFELEDGIYLLAPITWLGWLEPFVVAAGLGAVVYCLWTLLCVLRARSQSRPSEEKPGA